uniref:Proline-rich transmembrane protein 3 n=1 Tax=Nothobranchius kuhntae TaxID=321403 RepID=A0A1A8KNT0_NOTKU
MRDHSPHITAQQNMAPTSLIFLATSFSLLHVSDAQTIIGSSPSFPALDLPAGSSPTKQTVRFWPSLPPRGRSDVPIRVTILERLSHVNSVEQEERMNLPMTEFNPSLISVLSTQNPSRGQIVTQPSASRPRTDMAGLAVRRALTKGQAAKRGQTPPLPTFPSVADPVDDEPVTAGSPEDSDSQGFGSGGTPTATFLRDGSDLMPKAGGEMAQYQPQAQTMTSKVSDVKRPSREDQAVATATSSTRATSTTPQPEKRATLPSVITQQTSKTLGYQEENTLDDKVPPKQDSAAVTSSNSDASTDKQSQMAGQLVTGRSQTSLLLNTSPHTSTTVVLSTARTADQTTTLSSKTTQTGTRSASTTIPSTRRGASSAPPTGVIPVIRSRFGPTFQADKNHSIPLGHPRQAPYSTFIPHASPSASPSNNGTFIYWGDLSHTLALAWELHVYGSASLFLLLFAGAVLGLVLSPGTDCPHRGALALANALLFLIGGLRSALFFIDPYGSRRILPRPAVTALYNLPLPLLVWTQAALALLALRAAGVSVLPSTLEQPPLVAVLTVLQCTLLLAADLLSPALSPVVPITLQVLSLCWGLALCLGFLCYVFPRIRCPPVPHHGDPEETTRKAWIGNQKGVVLGRVLAVCAVLGALCCGLHVHACLWLYGLLGDWTRFNWGWWLVHFWARLLELAWGLSLLFLGSCLLWRSGGCKRSEEGGQDGRAAGELSSPGQSGGSAQRHTCWSKIVQSLRGKPCRKSDSNGVGGGAGEMPNNWAGQERSGADISKSLIRNQDYEQNSAQPRCVKDSNHARNHRGHSAERGMSDDSTSSLLRLQTLGQPPQRSVSGSLDQDKDTSLSLYEFDLRPPSPIDLTRSIDEALHREHLLGGGSLFHPLNQASPSPSPGSGISQASWIRRNSDPQLLSDSSEAPTESSMPLGGSILSSVPSRQVTAPPTPSHQGHRWAGNGIITVPSSVSCPVSLRPSRTSTGNLGEDGVDDTRPFFTPDSERVRGRAGRPAGSRSYLEVSRHDDSASMSSEIINL